MSLATLLPPAVAFLLAAGLAVVADDRRITHLLGAVAAVAALGWIAVVPTGDHLAIRVLGSTPAGFDVLLLAVDPISRTVGGVFSVAALAAVSFGYGVDASTRQTATALVYVGCAVGAVFAGDWLTLVVWWELLAVAATLLLWQSPSAVRAGYRYAVYHQLGGACLVAGVFLQYARTGTFLMTDGAGGTVAGVAPGLPELLVALGVGVNVGFLGLHVWIVDAYPRPHVATTVALSAFTTKVGVYTLTRVFPNGATLLASLGGVTVLVGVTMAILQTDVRRLLSYHIVSQVGYMIVGVGLGSVGGVAGGVAHLLNNVLYKTLLFVVAGAIVVETGRESLKELGGLGRRVPSVTAGFAVAALAITGIPGFSGFLSKGFVTSAATAAGREPLWWALQIGAVGTVVSFAKFGYYAFLGTAPDGVGGAAVDDEDADSGRSRETGPTVAVAVGVLAVPCVVFGVAPELFTAVLPPGVSVATSFSVAKLTQAAAITVAGVTLFAVGRRPLARVTAVSDLDRLYHPLGRRMQDATSGTVVAVGEATARTTGRIVQTAYRVTSDPTRLEEVGAGRATVGRSVLLVVVTLAVAVGLLLLS